MTDNPRFVLELRFSESGSSFRVQDPTILTDTIMDQAWQFVGDFLIDTLDEQGLEVDDEQFRELFIELCYKLVYREITTLQLLPWAEKNFKENLGTRKRGAKPPGGRYGS